jgi:hypothetical protein
VNTTGVIAGSFMKGGIEHGFLRAEDGLNL